MWCLRSKCWEGLSWRAVSGQSSNSINWQYYINLWSPTLDVPLEHSRIFFLMYAGQLSYLHFSLEIQNFVTFKIVSHPALCLNNWVCLLLHRQSWVCQGVSSSTYCLLVPAATVFLKPYFSPSFPPQNMCPSLSTVIWSGFHLFPSPQGCHQPSITISTSPSILVSYTQPKRKCSHRSLLSTNTTFFTFINCLWPCKFIKIKITIIKNSTTILKYIAKALDISHKFWFSNSSSRIYHGCACSKTS